MEEGKRKRTGKRGMTVLTSVQCISTVIAGVHMAEAQGGNVCRVGWGGIWYLEGYADSESNRWRMSVCHPKWSGGIQKWGLLESSGEWHL